MRNSSFNEDEKDFDVEDGRRLKAEDDIDPPNHKTSNNETPLKNLDHKKDSVDERAKNLKFSYLILSFKDIRYEVKVNRKDKKVVIKGVNGVIKPGLTAIMGPSGGGKTSILDILADRKYPEGVSGSIFVNRNPRTKFFKYQTGYVPQDDVMMGTMTVRENIFFSAQLRLPKKILNDKKVFITNKVIEKLMLQTCADSKVGTDLIKGISGGERKRTAIGIELVTLPSILFLDEPTTGLDASTAFVVIKLLKSLSDIGCNIIMSIHQPRYNIYKMFTHMILLSYGDVVYQSHPDDSLKYFENLGYFCETHNNPCDYFLDVIVQNQNECSIEKKEYVESLSDAYKRSSMHTSVEMQIDSLRKEASEPSMEMRASIKDEYFGQVLGDEIDSAIYKLTFLEQLPLVGVRTIKNILRTPSGLVTQMGTVLFMSIVIGLIYFQSGFDIQQGVQNRHENYNGFYRCITFFLCKVLGDIIPMRISPVFIHSLIAYWMIGFQRVFTKWLIFLLTLSLVSSSGASLCFLNAILFETMATAYPICGICLTIMMIFGGLLVSLQSIPNWLSWLQYLSIFRYGYVTLAINEFEGLQFCDTKPQNTSSPVNCITGLNVLENQSIPYNESWDLWKNVLGLFIFNISLLFFAYVGLRRTKKKR